MTREEFEHLINAHGGDPKRWPEDRRVEAERFISEAPDVADGILADARSLDTVLNQLNQPVNTELLKRRITKAVQQSPQSRPARQQPRWGAVAAMLAVSFVLGVAGGRNWPASSPDMVLAESEDVTSYADAADTLGVSDIYDWVAGEDL